MWKNRIVEIEETGNCKNKLGHPLFASGKTGWGKEEMITYCEKMIEKIKT